MKAQLGKDAIAMMESHMTPEEVEAAHREAARKLAEMRSKKHTASPRRTR
jgi:DNA topoisomerase VI subunit B